MVFDFFFIKFDLRMARTEGNIERLMRRFSISNDGRKLVDSFVWQRKILLVGSSRWTKFLFFSFILFFLSFS